MSGIPISEKCPNYIFGEFCNNMSYKTKYGLVFYSITVLLSWPVSYIFIFVSFSATHSKINSNYLKMSGLSSRNIRYPRYQDTDFLQLCMYLSNYLVYLQLFSSYFSPDLERDRGRASVRSQGRTFLQNIQNLFFLYRTI